MVALGATSATQNGNKCPHGLPIGACPICSGMGGGSISKDKNKPRVKGEMSYNECMAEWIKMQAQKDAKIQARIDRIENDKVQLLKNRMILGLDKVQKSFDKLMNNIEKLPQIISIPIKIISAVIIKPILNVIAKLPQLINTIQTFFSNITQFILSTGEKLATILGEIKNFINFQISKPVKKIIKTILSFFSQGEEEENEETEKLKMREIKKVIQRFFTKHKTKEEKEVEDDK